MFHNARERSRPSTCSHTTTTHRLHSECTQNCTFTTDKCNTTYLHRLTINILSPSLLKTLLTGMYILIVACSKARFPLPELTARIDGWPVSITHQHGPCRWVMETGHPSTRAVNSGSGNRALISLINNIQHSRYTVTPSTRKFTITNRTSTDYHVQEGTD